MNGRPWPALVLAFTVLVLVAALAPAAQAARPERVLHGLDYLHAQQRASGGFGGASVSPSFTPWAILAISASRESPQAWKVGGKNPVGYLQGLDLEAAAGSAPTQVNQPAFFAKVILAYVAAGRADLIGSAGSKHINMITKLLSYQNLSDGHFSPWGPTSTNPFAATSTTTWAIIALKAAGETDGNLSLAVDWLVDQQNGDGGFGVQPGATSEVDGTAAAIQALRAGGLSASSPVVQDAADYIRSKQRPDGGFPAQPGTLSYAESTAWAIQGLLAAGRTPPSNAYTFLRSLQLRSGAFQHRKGVTANPLLTTAEVLVALNNKTFPFKLASSPISSKFRPYFKSFTPADGAKFTTSTVTVKATYADNARGTGIRTGAIRITLDGKGKTGAATVSASSLTLKLTKLSNGTHSVKIRLVDYAGNVKWGERTFTVSVPVPPPNSGGSGSGSGSGSYYPGSGGSPTTPRPVPTPTPGTTYVPTPTPSASGAVTGTPMGPSPSSGVPSPGASPSPSASVTGQVATEGNDGDGGLGTGEYIGIGLAALLPLGALGSYLAQRRQEARLSGAGQGYALLGGGTPWERFKGRLTGTPHVGGK